MSESVLSSNSTACGKHFEEKKKVLAKGFAVFINILTAWIPQGLGGSEDGSSDACGGVLRS